MKALILLAALISLVSSIEINIDSFTDALESTLKIDSNKQVNEKRPSDIQNLQI